MYPEFVQLLADLQVAEVEPAAKVVGQPAIRVVQGEHRAAHVAYPKPLLLRAREPNKLIYRP
jgi:hypothetical protein